MSRFWSISYVLLLLALMVCSVRFVWRTSATETGWALHRDQWGGFLREVVRDQTPKLPLRDPPGQAEFWLAEVERVTAAEHDPAIAAGAAWMLDAPNPAFRQRHLRVREGMVKMADFVPPAMRVEFDERAINRHIETFNDLCQQACLARIERATQLEPDNADWWRFRALLLFRSKDYEIGNPRRDDWLEVLNQCADQDPDNALYDYLAAYQLWNQSASYDFDPERDRFDRTITIDDPQTYEEANRRFEAGLEKPRLMFGRSWASSVLAFLEQSSLSPHDHFEAVGGTLFVLRSQNLIGELRRWKIAQHDVEGARENYTAAASHLEELVRVTEQLTPEGNDFDHFPSVKWPTKRGGLALLKKLSDEQADLFDDQQRATYETEFDNARIDTEILLDIAERMRQEREQESEPALVASTLLMISAQWLTGILLLGGIAVGSATWIAGKRTDHEPPTMGWWRHALAWGLGFGLSFVLLGLCPAEVISATVQTYAVYGLLAGLIVLAVIKVFRLLSKRFEVPLTRLWTLTATFSLPLAALACWAFWQNLGLGRLFAEAPLWALVVGVCALLWLLWKVVHWGNEFLRGPQPTGRYRGRLAVILGLFSLAIVAAGTGVAMNFETLKNYELKIPARIWDEARSLQLSGNELQALFLEQNDGPWLWAMLQWVVYEGTLIAPLLTLFILAAWFSHRRAKQFPGGFREIVCNDKRGHIRQTGIVATRSLGVLAGWLLVVYLAVSLTVTDELERSYHEQHGSSTTPSLTWERIEPEMAAIKADPERLEEYRRRIER